MPRDPILPLIDWRDVFESAKKYEEWLDAGDNLENRGQMEMTRRTLVFEPHVEAMLRGLARPVHVVVIAEDWCVDVVRHVAVLQAMADVASNLRVRYITRRDHPEILVRFLTNGGEGIPKFIFLSDVFVECGNWGPVPAYCREIMSRGKACGDVAMARLRVNALYQADPGQRVVISELLTLIDVASSTAP